MAWMRDERIYVITSGLTSFFKNPPDGYQTTSVVDTEQMFSLYQAAGVLRPNIVPMVGDRTYQMCYTFAYHHLPTHLAAFKSMVATYHYKTWPAYRDQGWSPQTTESEPSEEEKFFHFYQTIGLWAFVYRLMQQGIIYDEIQALQKELPFVEALTLFLRANLVEGVQATDPLRLQSDVPVQAAAAPTEDNNNKETKTVNRYSPTGAVDPDAPSYSLVSVSPRKISLVRKGKNLRNMSPIPVSQGSDLAATEEEETIAIHDDDLEDWARQEEGAGSSEQPTASRSIKDRLGPRPQNMDVDDDSGQPAGGRDSGDRDSDDASPDKSSGKKKESEYCPADLRSRLLLLSDYFKVQRDEQEVSNGLVPAAQDVNVQFITKQRRRMLQDPFLIEMTGRMPFVEDDFDLKPTGPPIAKHLLDHDILTEQERKQNPFVDSPRFHRRCLFCSAQHCSRYFKEQPDVMACHKFRAHEEFAPTRDLCLYVRCNDRKSHHTPVCPALHQKCPSCRMRGHGPFDRCDLRNPAIMSRLRADFEQCAVLGHHTWKRRERLEWGWYHFTEAAAATKDKTVDYLQLSHMSVLDAIAVVQALCLAAAFNNNNTSLSRPLSRPETAALQGRREREGRVLEYRKDLFICRATSTIFTCYRTFCAFWLFYCLKNDVSRVNTVYSRISGFVYTLERPYFG